jgi:hypothetical protein
MKELKTKKMQVYKTLRDYKKTRDDDYELYLKYLIDFHLISRSNEIADIFKLVKKGEIMSFESVSRFRRMLQHEYPSLRGKTYGKRKKMVKQVQKDLGYNVKGGK